MLMVKGGIWWVTNTQTFEGKTWLAPTEIHVCICYVTSDVKILNDDIEYACTGPMESEHTWSHPPEYM